MKNWVLVSYVSFIFITSCSKNECKEKAKANCICTMDYKPVCGCNEKTYSNACEAECNGITNYTQGECK
ncbi:hypothetical protein CNR22_15430 [Sphingobacteriaceae bacterium]|nr:hypothetical protein CNR22_15430 [Sphingobacteriaceae bacterium]